MAKQKPPGLIQLINPAKEKKELVDNRTLKLGNAIRKGRPRINARKKLNTKQLYMLAETLLPMESIACIMGTTPNLIRQNYQRVVDEAREVRKHTLVSKMWHAALNGSEKMQIWLSKQHLGYKDSWPETGVPVAINIQINEVP